MEPLVSALCSRAPELQKPNPHVPNFFTVWVNDIGKKAMFAKGDTAFPAGSIIVKEKFVPRDKNAGDLIKPLATDKPQLLTVMIKHEKGYDTPNGDWEYFTCDGNAQPAPASTSVKHCQSCHQKAEPDHTYRTSYVPRLLTATLGR